MSEQSDYDKRNSLWGEYGDAYLDRGDESDPEYWSPERVANRERWRKGANLLEDNVAKAVTQDASDTGADSDTALNRLGFTNQKDHGKYIFGHFGNNGLYATEGAAVDPNLIYNWQTGMKTWKPGTDNAGQSIPINANERAEYQKAQQYRSAGLQGYGQQQQATNFQKAVGYGQFGKDAKGNFYNQANNGQWEIRDQYGRRVGNASGSQYDPKTGIITSSNPTFEQAGGSNNPNGSTPAQPIQEPTMPTMPFMSTPGQQVKHGAQANTHQAPQGFMKPSGTQQYNDGKSSTAQNWSMMPTSGPSVSQPSSQTQGRAAPPVYSSSVLGKPNAFAPSGNFNSSQAWTDDPLDPTYNKSGVRWLGNGDSQTWGAGYNPSAETPNTPSTPALAQPTSGVAQRRPYQNASMFNL